MELAEAYSSSEDDAECPSALKRYASLMPLAEKARKPMCCLRARDGALGGQIQAVQDCS